MRKRSHKYIVLILLLAVVAIQFSWTDPIPEIRFCAAQGVNDLTTLDGEYFTGSGNCYSCHATDPNGEILVDEEGLDVSMVNDWMPTMMANAAKDPFWRAKVSHEGLVNPNLALEIEATCTRCHAPMGFYEKQLTGGGDYIIADLLTDSLGQDGVSCMACHRIAEEGLGTSFSGIINYAESDVAYGPFVDPWDGPMNALTGINPVYSDHVRQSEFCSSCHTLITETVDLNGELTGNFFFEQVTYHEWLNSSYSTENIECQSCHMPEVEGGVIVANQPNWLFPQTPFGRHHFVGGNSFMLNLMKQNAEELDLAATPQQFDMVIDRTLANLESAIGLSLDFVGTDQDSSEFRVSIENFTGHKFPSGYPSRLAYLKILVLTSEGDTLFHSGELDENNRIINRNLDYEPHFSTIRYEEDVQIYEMVMADVEGNPTTVLERAAYPLKDNRLLPKGFAIGHSAYDTTLVAGAALDDEDFWLVENASVNDHVASDQLTYKVGLDGYRGDLSVRISLNYQSVPPRWLDEMFAYSSTEIDLFKSMYEEADFESVVVGSVELNVNTDYLPPQFAERLQVIPNPSAHGTVQIVLPFDAVAEKYRLYDNTGRMVFEGDWWTGAQFLKLPSTPGTYYLRIQTNLGVLTAKVVRIGD